MASGQETETRPGGKTALILSAGAPHSPLMAGALCALWDTGRTFDVIYTSGAGCFLGLLYAAPMRKSPKAALESLVDLGISDPIYRLLPVGYKTFLKPGPFSRPIRQFAQSFKIGSFPLTQIDKPATGFGHAYNEWIKLWETAQGGRLKRFYNDLVDLWAAAITPAPITYWSKGVCDSLPFLEETVDFKTLNDHHFPIHFYVNAFSITERHRALYASGTTTPSADYTAEDLQDLPTGNAGRGGSRSKSSRTSGLKMRLFHNRSGGIQPEQVRAAFAYPFIYPPVTIKDEVYFEGAARDPISFGNLLVDEGPGRGVRAAVPDIERIVLIDILAGLDRYLLREPRDLWDAFSLSILAPAVAHAQKEIARFHTALREANEDLVEADRAIQRDAGRTAQAPETPATPAERRRRKEEALMRLSPTDQALARITHFKQMSFDIDEELGPHITDWSYSNMSRLFEIGLRDGKKFWQKNLDALALPLDHHPR